MLEFVGGADIGAIESGPGVETVIDESGLAEGGFGAERYGKAQEESQDDPERNRQPHWVRV